jgi:hypothetical protein
MPVGQCRVLGQHLLRHLVIMPRAGKSGDLFGPDLETLQDMRPEGRNHGDIGGVSSLRDRDAPDARLIMAGVEQVPASIQIRDTRSESSRSDAATKT